MVEYEEIIAEEIIEKELQLMDKLLDELNKKEVKKEDGNRSS